MEHPKRVGDRSTLAVMLALSERGYDIAVPFGENTRYDLIIDDHTRLYRVQCKTGRLRGGAIEFPTASSYYHHPNEKPTQRHYQGQVDLFGVFCLQRAASISSQSTSFRWIGPTCVSIRRRTDSESAFASQRTRRSGELRP